MPGEHAGVGRRVGFCHFGVNLMPYNSPLDDLKGKTENKKEREGKKGREGKKSIDLVIFCCLQ